jgi:hypothetical protein
MKSDIAAKELLENVVKNSQNKQKRFLQQVIHSIYFCGSPVCFSLLIL